MPLSEQILRLVLACIAGGALGLNRRVRGKSAGLRTHALVSLGAAVVVLTADLFRFDTGSDPGALTRTLQGVVSGIGFIGAGAILKGGVTSGVRGLTTAASIWLAATVGSAAGAGYGVMALTAVAIAFVILVGGSRIELAARRMFEKKRTEERREGERRAVPAEP
jgi:putative Mg2+ transporter-C (MgtC) family protein